MSIAPPIPDLVETCRQALQWMAAKHPPWFPTSGECYGRPEWIIAMQKGINAAYDARRTERNEAYREGLPDPHPPPVAGQVDRWLDKHRGLVHDAIRDAVESHLRDHTREPNDLIASVVTAWLDAHKDDVVGAVVGGVVVAGPDDMKIQEALTAGVKAAMVEFLTHHAVTVVPAALGLVKRPAPQSTTEPKEK